MFPCCSETDKIELPLCRPRFIWSIIINYLHHALLPFWQDPWSFNYIFASRCLWWQEGRWWVGIDQDGVRGATFPCPPRPDPYPCFISNLAQKRTQTSMISTDYSMSILWFRSISLAATMADWWCLVSVSRRKMYCNKLGWKTCFVKEDIVFSGIKIEKLGCN